jgi:hypothetical protein
MSKWFKNWDTALQALVLIKIGQDLGCESRLSHMFHDFIEFFVVIFK